MENYNLSNYSIFIELEKSDNQYMALHGYTGAVDLLEKEMVVYLKNNKENLVPTSFPFSSNSWNALIKRGYITQKSKKEEQNYVIKLANFLHKRNILLHQYFTFLITYNCNFRCPYCYEAGLSNHGLNWSKKVFTKEMADKAYLAIDSIEKKEEYRSNTILLYGGEPLLKENRDIIEYIVNEGTKKGFVFHAITNGYDLEVYADLLGMDKIRFLQITLDGSKEIHNKRRRHFSDKETFDKIFNNIILALKKGIYVNIRINTDANNIDDIALVKKMIKNRGMSENKNLHITSALLVDYLHVNKECDAKEKYDSENDLNYLSYIEFVKKHKKEDLDIQFDDKGTYQLLYSAIKHKRKMHLKSTYCAAQYGSYTFDPYGNIFGCLESVGLENGRIGKYGGESVKWEPVLNKWQSRNSGSIEKCSKCKYAFMCKGGCVNQVLKKGGDFTDSFCEGFGSILNVSANMVYDKLFLKQNNSL